VGEGSAEHDEDHDADIDARYEEVAGEGDMLDETESGTAEYISQCWVISTLLHQPQ
jgi:hypothetical protein